MKFLAACFVMVFAIGCDASKKSRVQLSLPYYADCEKTISRVSNYFKETTVNSDYKLSIMVNQFDLVPYENPDVIGVVTLVSEGNWETLSGKSPLEYLKTEANSIKAECMPNNYLRVSPDNVIDAYARIGAGKAVVPKIADDEIILYFNDGSFSSHGGR